MKHAAKTLGVAALGAAFAAAAAGTASAAPQLPEVGTPLNAVSLLQNPAVASAVQQALEGAGTNALPPGPAEQATGLLGPAQAATGLLGGLPLR
ncbi:hypothetical protein [Streptomyces sp. NPDC002133]|uniref:hypothetical protein n=1 Tax=Streptomyces sp. NPDC002133 TaxID=3154409 RepID=UPI00331E6AB7